MCWPLSRHNERVLCALAAIMLSPAAPIQMKEWGLQTLETLRKEFRIEAAPGYADAIEAGKPTGPAFNWGFGVLLSAMNAAAKVDPAWKKELRALIEGAKPYWNPAGPVPGFDVLPVSKWQNLPGHATFDRYYDDNAWMVLALVESSEVLKDKESLTLAEKALKYVLSGEDEKLGGGIYWRESDKKSKNTCSNGPSAAACLAVYAKTKKSTYLEAAKRLYAWTKKNLQDPDDKLFWDNVSLEGKIEKTKWSYNTALMIRSAAMLAKATGDARYAGEAEEMAAASEMRWLVDGKIADAGRFAHLLLESWTYVPSEQRRERARAALEWLWAQGKNDRGLFGGRFDQPPAKNQGKFELIDQASAARAFLTLG